MAGWFEEDESDSSGTNTPLAAGQEVQVFCEDHTTGGAEFNNDIDEFSAIGPNSDGELFYVGIDGETLGLGLNIFGHKCLAVGTITLMELDNDDDN